jgi:hypothetical protein
LHADTRRAPVSTRWRTDEKGCPFKARL